MSKGYDFPQARASIQLCVHQTKWLSWPLIAQRAPSKCGTHTKAYFERTVSMCAVEQSTNIRVDDNLKTKMQLQKHLYSSHTFNPKRALLLSMNLLWAQISLFNTILQWDSSCRLWSGRGQENSKAFHITDTSNSEKTFELWGTSCKIQVQLHVVIFKDHSSH